MEEVYFWHHRVSQQSSQMTTASSSKKITTLPSPEFSPGEKRYIFGLKNEGAQIIPREQQGLFSQHKMQA